MRLFRNTLALLAVALLAAAPASAAPFTVTTADGNGADAEIQQRTENDNTTIERTGNNHGASNRIGVRTAVDGDKGRFHASFLRFDISDFSGNFTGDSTITVTKWRDLSPIFSDDDAIGVYGLNEGLDWIEGTEDGDPGTGGELTYDNAPGIAQDATAGDDEDIDSNETSFLGNWDAAAFDGVEGDEVSFTSSAITDFLNNDTDGEVTVILVREQSVTQFIDFASKEATSLDSGDITGDAGDFAPSLTFVPEPATVALLGLGGAVLLGRRRRRTAAHR